ncbi:DUF6461 domain-containing protein [Umezawaea sp.]|uniref:DUF6461 domain-containing protein n=1 Tax=Umezawaea sp. TaxID=1955258 RepID=UPI002ED45E10
MRHDLSWADAHPGSHPFLGEIFSLAFVRGVEPLDALTRVGALPDTLARRTPEEVSRLHEYDHGYPEVVSALALGEWTVLCQPTGFELTHLVDALSRGTEAVALLRHDYASPGFTHAVDGAVVTGFDPKHPGRRYGTDPDRLLPLMREAGFEPDSTAGQYDHSTSRALRLAGLVTGVVPTFDQLTAPLPSAHIDPWFTRTRPRTTADAHDLAERIVAELHLGSTPGLAPALAAARRGDPVVVSPDSELGGHVREWSSTARRASWSLNDPGGRHRMTDEERHRGYRLGHLVQALAAAFRADLA